MQIGRTFFLPFFRFKSIFPTVQSTCCFLPISLHIFGLANIYTVFTNKKIHVYQDQRQPA